MDAWVLRLLTDEVMVIERESDGVQVELPRTAAWAVKEFLTKDVERVSVPYV